MNLLQLIWAYITSFFVGDYINKIHSLESQVNELQQDNREVGELVDIKCDVIKRLEFQLCEVNNLVDSLKDDAQSLKERNDVLHAVNKTSEAQIAILTQQED
ncbi:hypothetical protein [Enterovibrio nigricans]|uniref:Uncharacterized protein n=1 Tax=Enterovibrio nigricans DSM 22720 TaxID=1121868 RepID=A0A1T4V606_9GAMM|nr:hypothetical protein [Enterovibrio nigricans]PKF49390.1 hypothetical protein AT251_19155 [Enterovibrio nigricans]SKA60346.1 hypothetical protein SAMN02745132_03287 [Enterovibrio nigricans DSM 22720]